jgi:hypothetical protein
MTWETMQPATPVSYEEMVAKLDPALPAEIRARAAALFREERERFERGVCEWWMNDRYLAILDRAPGRVLGAQAGKPAPYWHLSVRRLDREPVHDWRDLQSVKNDVVGPGREAVELYPAEERLVDAANQFHLWVLPVGYFNVGFAARAVAGEGHLDDFDVSMFGGKQRPVTRAERRRIERGKENS